MIVSVMKITKDFNIDNIGNLFINLNDMKDTLYFNEI